MLRNMNYTLSKAQQCSETGDSGFMGPDYSMSFSRWFPTLQRNVVPSSSRVKGLLLHGSWSLKIKETHWLSTSGATYPVMHAPILCLQNPQLHYCRNLKVCTQKLLCTTEEYLDLRGWKWQGDEQSFLICAIPWT
jgi:hypothetical protein